MAASLMTQGLKLFFLSQPPLHLVPPKGATTSEKQIPILLPVAMQWLVQGKIREHKVPVPLYFSRMFHVPKPNGSIRPIIDLTLLNRRLKIPRFRMETIQKIVRTIHGELWAVSIDIKDAYLHLPIDPEFQKYFAFVLGGRTFCFLVVPFGLSTAPWAFTRVIKAVKAHLHSRMVWIFSFLDDFLLLAKDPEQLRKDLAIVLRLLLDLGFNINWEKSSLVPQQVIRYLGVILDLKNLTLSLPEEKVQRMNAAASRLAGLETSTRRELESFLGLGNFCANYLPLGRLRLLPLVRWVNRHTCVASRDQVVSLSPEFRVLLAHWTSRTYLSSAVPMHLPAPSREIMTDASRQGWGGILLPHSVSGRWSAEDGKNSINWLELKAILLTIEHFAGDLQGRTVRVLADNSTALSCLRRQGSLRSDPLMELTSRVLERCHQLHISLIPVHLEGILNVLADQESRLKPISTEWALDRQTFLWVVEHFGLPQIDLFATHLNSQMPSYVSPCPDPAARAWDAFSLDWNEWEMIYLFPPVQLIPETIWKLWQYRGRGVLIAPLWRSAEWYPALLQRCLSPTPLPMSYQLFQTVGGRRMTHPNPSVFQLAGWRLSA